MNIKILKNGSAMPNEWSYANDGFDPSTLPEKSIIPLKQWNQHIEELYNKKIIPGLRLELDETPDQFKGDLKGLPIIAVHFPTFTDGRGFSLASLLRQRYQYKGELRACGHFIRDQLAYLQRCGFNSFEFFNTENLEQAARSLRDFSESYQASANQATPLFRRRND